ncbi:LytTr DNA-binding domain [Raineya orbicola]|jgi:DNA-binding LytR/AlgR family response regulator|uniref:LytTr DNA-binding domain n=2 Tax=Raineya orbicola TaxID=2016530 RepID=A0A2N3ID72_9BACT|nr:LytTr DNA-binding domain [Raineya orbicola]
MFHSLKSILPMKQLVQFIVDLEENCPLHTAFEKIRNLPFVKTVYLNTKKFLEIADRKQTYQIPFDEIISLQAMGNYTQVFTTEKTYCFSCSLKKLLQKLPDELFVRPHRSFAVNRMFVRTWGKDVLEISTGESIPISRRKKTELSVA